MFAHRLMTSKDREASPLAPRFLRIAVYDIVDIAVGRNPRSFSFCVNYCGFLYRFSFN
jgi:hypothetical protein